MKIPNGLQNWFAYLSEQDNVEVYESEVWAMIQRVHKMGIDGIPLSQLDGFSDTPDGGANYQDFVVMYAQYFYTNKVPFKRLTPVQGKAMKEIIKTLLALDVVNGDSLKALAAWKLVLENTDKLNKFKRDMTFDLVGFNKYIIEILQALRNETGTKQVKYGKYDQ